MMATTTTTTVCFSKDPKFYPDRTDFMKALQEDAVQDPKSPDGALYYPKLTKMANKMLKLLKDGSFPNYNAGANTTRTARGMAVTLAKDRKLHQKVEVLEIFHEFERPDGMVYILGNNAEFFGYDGFLKSYAKFLSSKIVTKQASRTPSDAIRVAAVMLHKDHIKAVAGILSGVRDRAKCDQSHDTTLAWAMDAVKLFQDPNFIVPTPADMEESDIEGIDPNDITRMVLERDGTWIINTWRQYLKKPYKAAIKKWDKETGGGSSQPYEFSNFCDSSSRWLVWVYLMDLNAGFLLYSNANGSPPSFVGTEAGFANHRDVGGVAASTAVSSPDDSEDDDDSMELGGGGVARGGRRKGTRSSAAAAEAKAELKKRGSIAARLIETIEAELESRKAPPPPPPPLGIMEQIIEANKKRKELEEASAHMPSQAKRTLMRVIDTKISALGVQFHLENGTNDELEIPEDDEEDGDW